MKDGGLLRGSATLVVFLSEQHGVATTGYQTRRGEWWARERLSRESTLEQVTDERRWARAPLPHLNEPHE